MSPQNAMWARTPLLANAVGWAARMALCLSAAAMGVPSMAGQPRPSDERRPLVIQDVSLSEGGVLRGRVVAARPEAGSPPRRVFLLREGRVVSEALADSRGGFVMQRLVAGPASLVVDDPRSIERQYCRLWLPQTAPPSSVAEVPVAAGVVRAQNSSFLTMGFPQAATLTGVAAGAIASPIIYHNIQQSHKAPAPISP